ncbi:MAG TPA: bifunctional riboflavin kinase/FAD synthetase [Steroidobacteraceae bacterium]|jgi:riboflavin kinase/FMN adenylyltransferase
MELIRGLTNLRPHQRGCAVTVGGFDGLHLGHQALIGRLHETAAKLGRRTMLISFEPMPKEYLAPQSPPARLTTWRERARLLEELRLDHVLLLRFGEDLRRLSGEDFAQILARDLKAAAVTVGHDFRFGRQGEMNAAALAADGPRLGFAVDVVPPVTVAGERVSSSGVRAALERGDLERARSWLGRPYSMIGRVVHGSHLGRELGFATANVKLHRRRTPLAGIFAVRVRGAGPKQLPGVASLGTRPTVGGTEPLLEAHVFDYAGDLYGREIEVEFVAKLRDEERFADLEALTRQMHVDAEQARRILEC